MQSGETEFAQSLPVMIIYRRRPVRSVCGDAITIYSAPLRSDDLRLPTPQTSRLFSVVRSVTCPETSCHQSSSLDRHTRPTGRWNPRSTATVGDVYDMQFAESTRIYLPTARY